MIPPFMFTVGATTHPPPPKVLKNIPISVNRRDLVGLFLLSQLVIPSPFIGLYRDDGLPVSSATKGQTEIMEKKLCDIFNKNKLQITTEANLKEVNFLDITLYLRTGTYKPYMKENDILFMFIVGATTPPGS